MYTDLGRLNGINADELAQSANYSQQSHNELLTFN